MQANRCQRWWQGRERYISAHADDSFDARRFSADLVDDATARRFVLAHHYSRSYPAACFRVGLFGPGARLLGVAVFSQPMNQRVVPAYCAVDAAEGLELGRFVLLDEGAPANSESWFLGRCFALLRRERPHLRAIVSYSDPVPRLTADGRTLTPGHVGIIYQAHNGRYLGRGQRRTLHLTPDGRVISPRTLSKIRLNETGARAAQKMLEALGAPARRPGEDGGAWVNRILACGLFRAVRHPGNHVYAWALASGAQRHRLEARFAPALPYPKRADALPRA